MFTAFLGCLLHMQVESLHSQLSALEEQNAKLLQQQAQSQGFHSSTPGASRPSPQLRDLPLGGGLLHANPQGELLLTLHPMSCP